jgi:hypothetical protein
MNLQFKDEDIARIGTVLGVGAKKMGNVIRFELQKEDQNRKLALEIYPDSAIGKRRGTLVSVYTPTAHLQLHFCTGFVVSEMLGELTFVGEEGGKLSGLTVEREGGCSLYANVDREILSGDFTTLGPEVMMSGIALSLTEQVLPEVGSGKTRKKAGTSRSQRAAKRTVR